VPTSYKNPIIKVFAILNKEVSISLKFQKRKVNLIKKEKHKNNKINVFNNESLSGKRLNFI
jgi:hypothetical protein